MRNIALLSTAALVALGLAACSGEQTDAPRAADVVSAPPSQAPPPPTPGGVASPEAFPEPVLRGYCTRIFSADPPRVQGCVDGLPAALAAAAPLPADSPVLARCKLTFPDDAALVRVCELHGSSVLEGLRRHNSAPPPSAPN
jgi:hypothetical protein